MNLNVSADIADAEPRTGQRNALCIATPEQEIFIRGDNKEIINGSVGNKSGESTGAASGFSVTDVPTSLFTRWTEQLAVYLRTSQQNQKKKRKVEPVATQVATPTSKKIPFI